MGASWHAHTGGLSFFRTLSVCVNRIVIHTWLKWKTDQSEKGRKKIGVVKIYPKSVKKIAENKG